MRRFPTNVTIDGVSENDLLGRMVSVGGCLLAVTARIGRRVMVTRAQPGWRGTSMR